MPTLDRNLCSLQLSLAKGSVLPSGYTLGRCTRAESVPVLSPQMLSLPTLHPDQTCRLRSSQDIPSLLRGVGSVRSFYALTRNVESVVSGNISPKALKYFKIGVIMIIFPMKRRWQFSPDFFFFLNLLTGFNIQRPVT